MSTATAIGYFGIGITSTVLALIIALLSICRAVLDIRDELRWSNRYLARGIAEAVRRDDDDPHPPPPLTTRAKPFSRTPPSSSK